MRPVRRVRLRPLATALFFAASIAPGLTAQEPEGPRGPRPRTISVSGDGMITTAPDRARFRVGVLTEAKNAREASTQNADKMALVVDALKKAGIPPDKIQTVQLTIDPVYDYNQDQGTQVLRGFQARNVVEVRTPDLGRLGEMLDAVIQVGGNTVEGIQFELEDLGAAQARALEEAVADARRKAEALAKAAGVGLREIQELSATYGGGPIPLPRPGFATLEARVEGAPPPVSPGELTVTATVQATYRIE